MVEGKQACGREIIGEEEQNSDLAKDEEEQDNVFTYNRININQIKTNGVPFF